MYTDYQSLPDSLESEELDEYFREFLRIYSDKPRNLESLEELHQLAYRQWDTYENLKPDVEKKLEEYLLSAIDFHSYEVTDMVISIVENLTLRDVFNFIVGSKDQIQSFAIKKLVIEAEEEYADSIDNPYEDIDGDWEI